ncbi:MAG: imidazolonepropionase, partial [Ginsengibacter sp.]
VVEDGVIAEYGPMEQFKYASSPRVVLKDNCCVLPAWCDSHTHLIFAEPREQEFVGKIKGRSYAEIAAAGGGILQSAKKLSEASEDFLFVEAWKRLMDVAGLGTGAIEIKSGYGLTLESELKMLRVIKKLKEKSSLLIKSTFLGAHAFPPAFQDKHDGYIDVLLNEMLPAIAAENLADYIDVFCETGFFSPGEMEIICKEASRYNMKPKLHVNQLNSIGGVESGIQLKALSLDHLENLDEKDIEMLGLFEGASTLLPTASFFLRMQYAPARQLLEAGAAIALASDFNPGSSPSGNMNFVVSLACIQMTLLPEEAINAATFNGACAMEIQNEAGSIAKGKRANLIFTNPVPSLAYLPYSFGRNEIDKVMINGSFL